MVVLDGEILMHLDGVEHTVSAKGPLRPFGQTHTYSLRPLCATPRSRGGFER